MLCRVYGEGETGEEEEGEAIEVNNSTNIVFAPDGSKFILEL